MKAADALGCHCSVDACEFLGVSRVWLGISFAAQDGLYAFGHYVPHAVEVAVDGGLVEQEFAESLRVEAMAIIM